MKDPTLFDLKHRIAIEKALETRAADGSVAQLWRTLFTCRAAIHPLSGNEFFSAQATQAAVSGRIWIRYKKGVTPKMRVNWDGRVYEILSVIDFEERRKWLQLMVSETV